MSMLKRMCGETRLDRIMNEIRGGRYIREDLRAYWVDDDMVRLWTLNMA